MTPADTPAPDAPTSIGRYTIVGRLAGDAPGDVFKGHDPVLQRPLAIKLLHIALDAQEPASIDRFKERFYREIQRVAGLVHPSIARLFDGGEAAGGFFIASEFIEGVSLADAIAQARPLELSARLAILRQIADALEYAREHDAPHLNLKTSNVLLAADLTVKVAGFGTARVQEVSSTARDRVTRFTSPEIAAGREADARADVYSFGAIAVELLGGAPIGLPGALPIQWLSDGSLRPMSVVAGLPGAAAAAMALARALAEDPGRRYPTAKACFDALNAALGFAPQRDVTVWDAPPAAAGLTAEQVKEIDSATTEAGIPTFAKSTASDSDATAWGVPIKPDAMKPETAPETARPGDPARKDDEASASRFAAPGPTPPPVEPPAVVVSDPSEIKTELMPSVPKAPAPLDRPDVAPIVAPLPPADADAGKTILIPRKKPDAPPPADRSEIETALMPAVPKAPKFEEAEPAPMAAPATPAPDADAGKTILIPRRKPDQPAPKPAEAGAPAVDRSELATELMPSVPKTPKLDAPVSPSPDPAGDAVIAASPADPGRTLTLSPIDARGTPPSASEQKTTLMPSAPKAAVFDATAAGAPAAATEAKSAPTTEKKAAAPPPPAAPRAPVAASPPPATPSPAPKPITFPPPPKAPAPPTAAPRLKPSSGAGPLLAVVGLVAVLAIAVAAWFTVPGLRDRLSRVFPTTSSSSAPEPPATTPPSTVPSTSVAPPSTSPSSVPVAEPALTPPSSAPPTEPVAVTSSAPGGARPVLASGSLRITSTPAGASVSIDGRRQGVTPLRAADLAFGEHAVEVSLDGYKAENRRVSLSARRASQTVNLRLTKVVAAPPATGAISVITEPAGARVIVDGAAAGAAPLTVANLAPGRHTVQTEREGYEAATRDVDVKAGETLPLAIKLTAAATRPPATPEPAGPIPFESVETKPRQTRGASTPPYPRIAAQARLAGFVELAWIVDENGAVSDVRVLASSSRVFEGDVVAWAKGLRYEPGRQGGRPVKVRFVRRFTFRPA